MELIEDRIFEVKKGTILTITFTALDVLSTIIARFYGIPEANKYVLILMDYFGFYGGLFAYFLIVAIPVSSLYYGYKNPETHQNELFQRIHLIYFSSIWLLAFTRIWVVLFNFSQILKVWLFPRVLLQSNLFAIFGFSIGVWRYYKTG